MRFSYIIGKSSEPPYDTKSSPGRIALRRSRIMSQKRPAAGGESAFGRFFLMAKTAKITDDLFFVERYDIIS